MKFKDINTLEKFIDRMPRVFTITWRYDLNGYIRVYFWNGNPYRGNEFTISFQNNKCVLQKK